MANVWWGVVTVGLSVVLFWMAWVSWRKRRSRVALALIVFAGLIIRVFAASDLYLHPWDERYHALVAKNLISHPLTPTLYDTPLLDYDYRNWLGNHVWLHKQPVPLWAMAVSMRLFGVNEIALRLPSIALSTLAILLTYGIGTMLWNRRVGLLAAFLHAIDGQLVELTAGRAPVDHFDLFHLVLIELAVFASVYYAKSRATAPVAVLIGGLVGLAILTKWLTALIVLPVWLLLTADHTSRSRSVLVLHTLLILSVAGAVSLPWQWYIHDRFPEEAAWESSYNRRHLTEALEGHSGGAFFHVARLGRVYGELVYVPLAWFGFRTIRRLRSRRYAAMFAWFLIPLVFFSIAKTKMPAYTSFVAPSVFLMTALFLVYGCSVRRKIRHGWILTVLMCLLIILPIRYSLERLEPFKAVERNPLWARTLRGPDQRIPDQDAVIFGSEHAIETMFYSSHVAYPFHPTERQLELVRDLGYTPYLMRDDRLVRLDRTPGTESD